MMVSGEMADSIEDHLKELIKDQPKNTLADIGVTITQKGTKWEVDMPMMYYYALLLYKMSEPAYKQLQDGFAQIINDAHALDLLRCYPKIASAPGSFWIGSILNGFLLNDTP